MSEFKQLEEDRKRKRIDEGGRCKFCIQILALPKPKIVDFYNAMLDTDNITSQTITDVLRSWNIDVSKTGVDNHRRGYESYGTHMVTIKKVAKSK
jgi:hypothetical protein